MKLIKRRTQRETGFTLVATLLIITLLTLLVVAALAMSQIEQQVAFNSSLQEQARQNALFGLNQALNQLQTSAGPDCRTTARADIINPNSVPTPQQRGYSQTSPATDSGQSYWTGVWKTTANDYAGCAGNGLVASPDPAPNGVGTGPGGVQFLGNINGPGPGASFLYYDYLPNGNPNPNASSNGPLSPTNFCPSRLQLDSAKNVTWLISWPYSSSVTQQPDPTQPLANQLPSSASLVVLANNLNAKTSANANISESLPISVMAPKVPIMANNLRTGVQGQTGSFAYWVSDEGIKAKVNVPDPYLAQTYPQSQGHFQIAQAPNVAAVLNTVTNLDAIAFNSPGATEIRANPCISPSLASLCYADPAGTWFDFQTNAGANYSADFTVSSLGVLADNFNGGLRKDLTAALENQQMWFYNFGDLAAGVGIGNLPTNGVEQCRKVYGVNAITGQGLNLIEGLGNCSNPGTIILDGLRWDSLFYYYNLYKTNMPSPIYTGYTGANSIAVGGSSLGTSTVVAGSLGPAGVGAQTTNVTIPERLYWEPNSARNYVYPLLMDPILPLPMETSYSTYVALHELTAPNPVNRPTGGGGTPGTYDLLFYGQGHMVYYNPYNVLLSQPKTTGTIGTIDFSFNSAYATINNPSSPGTPWNGDIGGAWTVIGTFQIAPGTNATGATTSTASTVWGTPQFSISTNDPPLNPGELRVYGPTSTSMCATPQPYYAYPGICYDFSSSPTTFEIPNPGAFTLASIPGHPLASTPNPFTNYSGEEVQLVSSNPGANPPEPHNFYNLPVGETAFQGYHDDIFTLVTASHYKDTSLDSGQQTAWSSGSNSLYSNNYNPYQQLRNFPTWPNNPTATLQSVNFDGYFIAMDGTSSSYFGTSQSPSVQLGLVGNSIQSSTATPPLDNLALISLYRDGVCGYATKAAVNENSQYALGLTGSNCTASYDIALPIFASSPFFNPFSMGNNNSFRTLYSTSDSYANLSGSQISPNTFVSGNSATGAADTTWLPDAVGNAAGSQTPFCLKEIPRGPLISLGQFKNMNCQYRSSVTQVEQPYSELSFSIYPVGGSYQESIPCNYTYLVYPGNGNSPGFFSTNRYYNQYLDDNFLGNETLFDGYFLSTVPPHAFTTINDANDWPINASGFSQSYIDQNKALANSRLIYYDRSSSNTLARTPSGTTSPSLADLQPTTPSNFNSPPTFNIRKPAANLLINGAFNINSTSIPAWEAILTSTNTLSSNNKLTTYQVNNYQNYPSNATFSKTSFSFAPTDVPFLNFSTLVSPLTAPNQPWYGLVKCQTSDISLLAQQIVNQVQLRGPFLSLGDFLNRRLSPAGTNSTLSNSGAIQAAIDSTNINYNVMKAAGGLPYNNYTLATATSLLSSSVRTNSSFSSYPSTANPPPAPGTGPNARYASAMGIPGTLMQQDVVQAIAPVIADRSDTFTIRAYGESVNPGNSSKIEGKAWCEAIVQRVPEYIYSTENNVSANGNCAYDDPSPTIVNSVSGTTGLSTINHALGRRFKIISFRWLNSNEL